MGNPKVKNIVIHGYYGAGNYGDDIILFSIINSLYRVEKDIKITVLSRGVHPIPKSNNPFEVISRYNFEEMVK